MGMNYGLAFVAGHTLDDLEAAGLLRLGATTTGEESYSDDIAAGVDVPGGALLQERQGIVQEWAARISATLQTDTVDVLIADVSSVYHLRTHEAGILNRSWGKADGEVFVDDGTPTPPEAALTAEFDGDLFLELFEKLSGLTAEDQRYEEPVWREFEFGEPSAARTEAKRRWFGRGR